MSHAVAARSSGGRCVTCNSRTRGGWFCDHHGINNTFVSARVSDDYVRPYRPHSQARYVALSDDRATVHDQHSVKRVRLGNGRYVICHDYPQSPPPTDPRRWCDECISYMRHRPGCALIFHDGPLIGGYETTGPVSMRFGKLRSPTPRWLPSHHRQHRRAVRQRWRAFIDQWTKIALHVMADSWTIGRFMPRAP